MNAFLKAILMLASIAACVAVSVGVSHYSELQTLTEEPQRERPAQAVEVTTIQQVAVSDRINLVGTLEANAEANLRPKSENYITKIHFDLGDEVTANKTVIELDKSRALEAISQADAALRVSKAQLRASNTRLNEQTRNLTRVQKLVQSNVSTQQELTTAETQHELALAEVELNKALVDQANSALLSAQLDLKECSVNSSLSGYVAERFAEVGDLADPGTVLMRIVDLSSVYTVVHVTERDYSKIKVKQTARIEVDAYPGKVFQGFVESIAPQIDIETRTASVKIRIENEEAYLKPGMYARVSLLCGERPKAKVVPLASVMEEDGKPFVFVIDEKSSTARKQIIKPGILDGSLLEVKSGLSPEDQIVTLGNRLISDGDKVEIMRPDMDSLVLSDPEDLSDSRSDSAAE